MNEGKNNTRNSNHFSKYKIMPIVPIILAVIIVITAISLQAYAKYLSTHTGKITADIADVICTIEVEPSADSIETVNPYCTVTVKNYNEDDELTQTDVNFKIEVAPKENFQLPEYYWEDEDGTIVAQSTDLTGIIALQDELGIDQKQEKEYTIYFINPGVEEITRKIEFTLTATQKK